MANVFIMLIILLVTLGCGIQHSVYTSWKYDTIDANKYKKDNYLCRHISQITLDSSIAKWNNTELVFIDMTNDISVKYALEEYYKCMDAHGWKIKSQFVNVNGKEIDDAASDLRECRKYINNDDMAKKCFSETGWYLIGSEPWIYEYDDIETVKAKVVKKHSDISGKWKGSCSSTLTGLIAAILTIDQNESIITGTYATSTGASGIVSGSINGDELSFSITPLNPRCSGIFNGKGFLVKTNDNISILKYSYQGSSSCGGAESGAGTLTYESAPD